MMNVPMFKDEGELHLNGSYSLGDEIEGLELQAAYSITPRVGVMANFISASGGEKTNGKAFGFGKMAEIGVGYIVKIDNNFLIEAYAGAGIGNLKTGFYNNSWAKANFSRKFFQPSVSYSTKYFDIGIATRFASLNYTNVDIYNSNVNSPYHEEDFIERDYFILEPGVIVRGGWENVKLQAQFVTSFARPELQQGNFNLSLGVAVSLDTKLKKKKEEQGL